MTLGLYGDAAPASVKLFEQLCSGSVPGEPGLSYAGSPILRVEPGRLIEAGKRLDLASGVEREIDSTGRVRSTTVDRAARFANADTNRLSHDRAGLLSMRRGGGSYEFLLTTGADPSLDATHLVIGSVLEGERTLAAIDALPVRLPSKGTELGGVAALYGLRIGVAAGVSSFLTFRLGAPALGLGVGGLTLGGMTLVGDDPRSGPDLAFRPLTKVRLVRASIDPQR